MTYANPARALLCAAMFALPVAARAEVAVDVDLATQHMHVQSAQGSYDWPISSARTGYVTPAGTFKPERMMEVYHSKKYDNAPMPHAIFFFYGFAIHGTNETKHLGSPASHGCIRLAPANAARLCTMVKAEGATITVTGAAPGTEPYNVAATTAKPSGGLFSFLGL